MSTEEELTIFDFYWFEHCILRKNSKPNSNSNLDLDEEENEPKIKLYSTPSFIVRSFSDQALSSKDCLTSSDDSPSPKSVLLTAKLQTILSGEEVEGLSEVEKNHQESITFDDDGKMRRRNGRRRRRSNNSKSLSELEFEELKGFMDLGFVFTDEDRDSSLVSIIPGLQRLGRKEEEEKKESFFDESAVSRPYLSEAWDVLDEKKNERELKQQLMNWRINPGLGNEMEIKDQLKFWAHTVASTVR